MTLCPIALAVGCKRCFAVGFCPLKRVIGDFGSGNQMPAEEAAPKAPQGEAPIAAEGDEPGSGGDDAKAEPE